MMELTPAYQTILESDQLRPVFLIDLPGLRLTTAPSSITWGGELYVASGLVMAVDGKNTTSEISANTYKIRLSNADQTALTALASDTIYGLPCTIRMGLLDDTGTLITEANGDGPFEFYKGLFDSWVVKEDNKSSTLEVTLRSHWAAFERKAGRWTNNESQQEQHPGDTIFEYAHLDTTSFKWGGIE